MELVVQQGGLRHKEVCAPKEKSNKRLHNMKALSTNRLTKCDHTCIIVRF